MRQGLQQPDIRRSSYSHNSENDNRKIFCIDKILIWPALEKDNTQKNRHRLVFIKSKQQENLWPNYLRRVSDLQDSKSRQSRGVQQELFLCFGSAVNERILGVEGDKCSLPQGEGLWCLRSVGGRSLMEGTVWMKHVRNSTLTQNYRGCK